MSFPTRQLGKNGPQVSAIGFGLMGLSAWYGTPPSDEERFQVLDRAHELGETFWDSADIYNDSEDLLGKWFARTGKRDEIFLATKFAFRWEDEKVTITGTAAYVKEACEKSLKRLGVDHIDLYYYHRMDTRIPIEETIRAMAELVKAGKVKHLALSSPSASTLRRAHAIHPISAIQVEYSPFYLPIESAPVNLLQTCRELGIAVVAYCPLGRGLTTGVYTTPEDFEADDMRRRIPTFMGEELKNNLKQVAKLAVVAKRNGITPAQLSLAWILAQGDDFIPIPGTKRIKYLEENLAAVNVKLGEEDLREVREICKGIVGRTDVPGLSSDPFEDTPPFEG